MSRDGRTIRDANYRVKPGEAYRVGVPPAAPAIPQGQDIPLAVVHEDKDLIVIDKPAGLVVHPAAGNPDGTLVNALIAHCGPGMLSIGGEERPGIVHRLDKDTSGLLVAAKTERAMASLAKQFANHTIERAYHAVVWGAPREASGLIDSQIGCDVVEVYGDELDTLRGSLTPLAERTEMSGETLFCYVREPAPLLAALHGKSGVRYLHRPANLEDVFLKLTGREMRD